MTEPRSPRSATIFDVARLAGVSHQTVSRVINEHQSVKAATRERVEEAIRQLRYRPSQAARALVTKRSRTVGVIVSGLPDFGPSMLTLTIASAAHEARYSVVTVHLTDAQPASVRSAIEAMLRQNVEAVVLIATDVTVIDVARAIDAGTPIITIAAGSSHPFDLSIDQYGGARRATRHLLDLGFATVAHVAGPPRNPDALERVRGWSDELRSAGAPLGLRLDGDWTPSSGYAAGLSLPVDPGRTAVFAGNDQMAFGLIAALRERAFSVPEDVSIVSFDDIPEAEYAQPALTTIRQDFAELGRRAVSRMIEVIEAPESIAPPTPIPTQLVVRASDRQAAR